MKSCIVKFFGKEVIIFFKELYILSFTISFPRYLSWQGQTGRCTVLMFVLDHPAPDNHLLLLLLGALEKKRRTVCSLLHSSSGQQLFYYSVEMVNGI